MSSNKVTQPSKHRANNWVKIRDDVCRMYNTNIQIIFKTTMLKSSLCDYSDTYILVKGPIIIYRAETDSAARQADEITKQVIFTSCVPFTDCISKINNIQVDNAKELDVMMPMYKVIK